MDEDEHLAEVIPLRPNPQHFPCPNCGSVWFEALIALYQSGRLAARGHLARCHECQKPVELPGPVAGR